MTVKEIIEKTKELEIDIEKKRQKAAYAAKEFWTLLEYPQVVENEEDVQKRWENVANTLADLRDVVVEYEELLEKEVKED